MRSVTAGPSCTPGDAGTSRSLRALSDPGWLDASELRSASGACGCRRTKTGTKSARSDDRGRCRGGHHRLRHRPRVRPGRVRAGSQREASGPRASWFGRRRERARRDQGRHDASRRRLDPGRPGQGDSRGLRSEPGGPGRPAHRPLPHPRTGSADAVANIGARPGSTRGRGRRAACRTRKRQPPPAGRGTRARPRRRGPGRAQPLRRHRAQRRSRRALRREGDRRDRPLSARRAPQGGSARPSASPRLSGGGTRCDRGRGRARMVAGARTRGHSHSRRAAPGDRALRRARGDTRARSRRPSGPRRDVRRAGCWLVHHGGTRPRRPTSWS